MAKQKKAIWIVSAVLLLIAVTVGLVWAAFGTPQGGPGTDSTGNGTTAPNAQMEVTAADEQELRELLAKDADLVISVSNDMKVREGFVVNGTKTLTGSATVTMELGAELGQSIFAISEDSALTLDGLVLDCNYNADGILVNANAAFNCLSGSVKHAGAYGILAYGDVMVEDISIEGSEFIAICAQSGSRVHVKGGSIQGSASNDVYVVPGGYVNISGDTVMEGALEHAMINYGTLEIHGGKFGNVNNYLCDNYGELTVAYKGDDKDGAVEFYGARNSIFLVRGGSTASFSGVYIHDTNRQGIASLGGDTTISDCKFENTGNHSIDIQGGKATVDQVVITASKGSGLEASNGAEVKVTNFTVNSCEKIGIASRGANITASNVTISNTGKYGITCGTTKTGQGILTVEDAVVKATAGHGVYVYDEGKAELKNIQISDGASRGMYIAATAQCKLYGESSIQNMGKGGVEVRGKLQLDDVVICNNHVQNSGAGVYVADGGEVTMNGGSVHSNSSALRGGGICVTDATLTINGTKVYENTSVNHGGGVYVQKNAVVNLNDGEIAKNYSAANGDGIYILSAESKVMVGENFYLGGNDVKLDNVEAVLYITGNGLNKHSASDPLRLTPNYNAKEGTAVASCVNENVAKSIASLVASGDGSYSVTQNGKQFTIGYTKADMDMTGADTVYVSNFKELEDAVLGTTGKRIVVLKADIQMERRIRLPGGATIRITDDGTKRTLSRADGFTDSFFVTHYGTGLYLTGTEAGKLVLDGGYTAEGDAVKHQSLVRVAGSTELKNVVLQNNGTLLKENEVRGALVRQLCGDIKIYDSLLSGGKAYAGGALMIDQGKAYIEDTVFDSNASTIGGGAIRAAGGCEVEIVSSGISGNHAGSTGGGIVALEKSQVTVTNTRFENNTAASYGGAVSAQDQGTKITLIGTDSDAVFKNNSSVTAGAVYVVKSVQLEISGYTFEENAATAGRAGAVSVLDQSTATITDTEFIGNSSFASGGAVVVDSSKVQVVSCAFENNTAGDKAAAVLVCGGATVEMTTADKQTGSVKNNTAAGVGGAIYVEKESTLKVENYLFEGNTGSSGGAIYIVNGAKVVSENNQFIKNAAVSGTTYGNGGAVYVAGTFTDTGSSYTGNLAKNGGAVIIMGTGNAVMDAADTEAVMKDNTATVNGGAVFVNSEGVAAVSGYELEGNTSAKAGAIQVQVGATATLNGLKFIGDTGNGIYVNGKLTFGDLNGAQIVQTNKNAELTVNSYTEGNSVEFTPYEYTSKVVLNKAETMSDADFRAACGAVTVTETDDGQHWFINSNGELTHSVAVITTADETLYFSTLEDAVRYANENGSAETVTEITVLENTKVFATMEISKNVAIVNASGKTVTVKRGFVKGDLFAVNAGGALTLGTNAASETGKLVIDGASTNVIEYRIVTVNSGAAFTLGKNASLENAKSGVNGAAVYTESDNTVVYGTIRNNVTSKAGAGLYVAEDAKVTIDGAAFIENRAASNSGALRIDAGAEVVCQNALFQDNKALTGETYANGGAIYCAGTFKDTNSSYIGNVGKNGGAIIVMDGGIVTLNGTNAETAVFTNNQATGDANSRGGAIFVNSGCTANVTGYSFEGNTSTGTKANAGEGAVHVIGSASLKDVAFQGTAAQKTYVLGSLTFDNVTGAHLVQAKEHAAFTVSGYQTGNVIEFTPAAYTPNVVLVKADAMADENFQAACKAISVVQTDDGKIWNIDATGKLTYYVASITTADQTRYFNTLNEAVTYANGGNEAVTIVVLEDTKILSKITVSGNVTIENAAGKTVTITRGFTKADMFVVTDGAELTLGSNIDNSGKLIINGASTNAIAYRTVTVESGAAFTLCKNASLQNANSSVAGAAIHTASTETFVYGTIQNNTTTADCGGLYVAENAEASIDGASFIGNKGGTTAGALRIDTGARVESQNARFENNHGLKGESTYVNGGAVYCAGTFIDADSSYIGNTGKNGGAIIVMSGGNATLTGTGNAAVFTDNTATGVNNSRGGAVFVNSGGSASVTGYTFEGNTSTGTTTNTGNGAVHIIGSATLKNVIFRGDETQKTYIEGSLTIDNVTGIQVVMAKNAANLTVSGYSAGNTIGFTPFSYDSKTVLFKASEMSEGDFAAACTAIAVTQTDDGRYWSIDDSGKLTFAAVSVTIGETTKYYETLEEAVSYANANGSTGESAAAQIVIWMDASVNETITVSKNVMIINASGEEITVGRGNDLTADMFTVTENSGAMLTLGANVTAEGDALIIDGASTGAIAGRTVTVNSGASFTLGKNATLQGANSTVKGAAIYTISTEMSYVYGTIQKNTSTSDGAGLLVDEYANVTITGATFKNNIGGANCAGAALCIYANATVKCENATFEENKTSTDTKNGKNGGAVYTKGKFTDNGSSYTGNEAKNGGAIFTAGGTTKISASDTKNATFNGNKVGVNGAAVYANGGTLTIRNSTCTGNTKTTGVAVATLKKGNGTLYIGVNVVVDGTTQTVTEPTNE